MIFWKVLGVAVTAAQLGQLSLFAAKPASEPKAANFALLDHEGRFHELDYYSRMEGVKAIALFVQGNGCPFVRESIPELKRLRDAYQQRGILFGMINANAQDDRAEIAEETEALGIDFPVLMDESQVVAEMLNIRRTAEIILVSAETKDVLYRGAIDDRLTTQKEKPEASERYFEDAVNAFLSGEAVAKPKTEAPGGKVTLADESGLISYSEHIVPILKSRCVSCHTKGGIGPFAMSNYKKVRGWSDMIEEVILSKQMPPWHADPHIGKFVNDGGLTSDEQRKLISWVRAGSPRGGGEDGLEGFQIELKDWKLGEPDHVFELPEQKVAAEGVFDYRYVEIDSPFEEDVWIRAMEVNPGNSRVLHHVVITGHRKEDQGKRRRREKWITGYAPGTGSQWLPEGTGVLLPKGMRLRFQLHYTASGKPETDRTRFGLHLATTTPEKEFKSEIIIHPRFRIPPNSREHPEEYTHHIRKDILLHSMNPHMHYRGKRMSFELHRPDGTKQPLLSVPNYNFNWQRTYKLAEPMPIAAGSKIVIKNAWDNSSLNPHNPDPSKTVTWGDQSFEEMFFASMYYVYAD